MHRITLSMHKMVLLQVIAHSNTVLQILQLRILQQLFQRGLFSAKALA